MIEDYNEEGKLYDPHLTRRMLGWTRPYRPQMALALFALILLAVASNVVPLLTKHGIDTFIGGAAHAGAGQPGAGQPGAGQPEPGPDLAARYAGLLRFGLWIGGLALFIFVFRAFQLYVMSWVGQKVIRDLRAAVFEKLLRLPMRYFDQVPVGRLMTRVTSDMDALQNFVSQGVVGLLASLMMLIGVMVFTLYLNWKLALALFVILPVLFGLLSWVNHHARKAYRDERTRQSILNTYLQENITGMQTVQLFNREPDSREQFDRRNLDLLEALHRSIKAFSYYFPNMEIMNAVAQVLVLLAGGWMVLQGEEKIGTLFAFVMYIREFFRPLEELSDKSNIFQSAMASSERIFTLLDEVEAVADPERPESIEAFRGEVEFDHVTFAYKDEDWILRDVNFHVKPGESLALVGATGAGKTSIISLIARFYDVQRGGVKVDGHDVRAYRQTELRRRVGIVLQDPFIFSGDIASNISMNNPEISRDDVITAARYVNAHKFIVKLPRGYETQLGERGSNLSTGQKQLLALARVLAQNPDILLILDEATANVDTETELLIQNALEKLMRDRTTIIIAHRLSTIKDVDRILVMRKGRVIEDGSHQELIRQDGYYRTLYELLSHAPGPV